MARLTWNEFEDALARRPLACWWRDDDATALTVPLKRLMHLSEKNAIPLALAVIPEAAESELFRHLHPHVSVLQHGTDHRNRAAPGEKKTEYPAAEPMEQALSRIADGFGRLRALAGAKLQPVLAPPWNRVRADLLKKLPAIGIRGVSGYGARLSAEPAPGVRQLNTHVDLIDWRGSRGFIGEAHALSLAMQFLSSDEPLGWLTHHAVHDAETWKFLERLFTQRDIRWLSAAKRSRILGRRMADLLTVRDLKVHIAVDAGTVKAVDGVSFRVPAGGTVALVGESGSGKSVVAQSIMGILPRIARIESGEILFRDPKLATEVDISRLDPASRTMRDIRGGRISIIFQEPMTALSPLHTIGNQIGEALALHRDAGRAERRAAVVEMLRLTGFPDPAKAFNTYPFELSGGLRQRAMIAMALVCRPALLVADEPTTALDVTIQAQILQLIQQLQGELGMAVLLITHDLGVVANMADEVVVMHRGRVMESGPVADIFRDARHPYLKALMRAVPRFNMAPGERLTPIRDIQVTGEHLITSGTGRFKAYGGKLLQVRSLTKHYATRKRSFLGGKQGAQFLAVDDVSFDVAQGECLGLVGESGCGKTTTARMILRSVAPDSGEILFKDQKVLALKGPELFAYRRKVQFVFQDPFGSLNPRMTVYDIVSEPLVIHGIGDAQERFARVKELMGLVGLDLRHLRRYPHSFSGGQRQRIGIARALALGPELLICDEPVSALDVSVQAQVLNLLADLRSALGLTYLFISHNLAVVNYLADRIAVMCAGRIVELAPAAELFRNPVHPYTQALLAAVPEPDLARKLDFDALMEGKASDPAAWPPEFRITGGERPTMQDIGQGHLVRAA